MQILNPAQAADVSGGAGPDVVDQRPINGHPVPIWHPVFVTDP